MDVEVNYLAVLLATVAAMVVGYVWYNPKVFGNAWIKLAKIDPKASNMTWSMGSALVGSFLMAFVLAHLTFLANSFYNNEFIYDALLTGFWVWLGFQFLRPFMHDQFNQRRKKESLIHMGNDFVTIMVMALVIGLLGV
ncbi:MAG: hypothetical protein JWN82_599 [Candidatus Saccharibacteria bacterium]|nr:hypothetical protein [Candidatus Saccharibacteria bacterium]